MQCKPVTALPGGEKWTFEIKFDGYRCIAVKRDSEVTLFSRNEKVLPLPPLLNKRFQKVVDALASAATSFSMGNWSPSISKGGPESCVAHRELRDEALTREAAVEP